MSIPIFFIAIAAFGFKPSGLVPALRTVKLEFIFLSNPSAICDLAALPVQMNNTVTIIMDYNRL